MVGKTDDAMRRNIVNPFICNGYEGPSYFCGRKKETEELLSTLNNGRNITLVSPVHTNPVEPLVRTFPECQQTGTVWISNSDSESS